MSLIQAFPLSPCSAVGYYYYYYYYYTILKNNKKETKHNLDIGKEIMLSDYFYRIKDILKTVK